MENKGQLEALVDRFLARAPGIRKPEHIEFRLDQFKREYEAHGGRAFLWGSRPGIYYFFDGKGESRFWGSRRPPLSTTEASHA
jgi:hypothetical protein